MINALLWLVWFSQCSHLFASTCILFYKAANEEIICEILTYTDMKLTELNISKIIDYREYRLITYFYQTNRLRLHFLSGGLILNASFELKENNFEQLLIEGAHGIDYNFSPNKQRRNPTLKEIYFNYGSLVQTYSNSREIKDCSLNEIDTNQPGPFDGLSIFFEPFTRYEPFWCPLLLYQSNIDIFKMNGQVDSLIKRNLFSFRTVNDTAGSFWVQFEIFKVYDVYQLHVTRELLSPQVVALSKKIYIWGVVRRIDPDTLRQIDTNFQLIMANPREFFCNNPDWLSMLNYSKPQEQRFIGLYQNEQQDLTRLNKDTFSEHMKKFYHFADRDFCLFANYPVNQTKYFFHIGSYKFLDCTCTIVWLLQNYAQLRIEIPWNDYYPLDSNRFCSDLESRHKLCKFEHKLSLCKVQSIRYIHETGAGPSLVEIVHSVLMVKYALVVIMQPFFCLVIFIINILTFLVIRRMHRLRLPKKSIYMYENIGFNSMCHVVLSVLFGLQPLIECIAAPNGIFCNSLFINDAPRLFYLLGMSFLGNAAKLCSNLTMIAFSLHRYLINKDKTNSRLLRLFQNIKPKKMFAAIIFGSLILSSVKLFVNERLNLINFFIKKDFLYLVDPFGDGYRPNFILSFLFGVNQLFNDILANIIILYIDYKCYRIQVANTSKRSKILGQNQKIEQSFENTSRMIIINGVLTAFLRAPELLADFYKFQHNLFSRTTDLCIFTNEQISSVCRNIYDISQFFYSLSGLLNFCLLIRYDRDFEISFRRIF
nr:G protein-coupled receptor [Proales similis]